MKHFILTLILSCIVLVSAQVNALIINSGVGATESEAVTGDSGWLLEDAFGDSLDFFILDITETTDLEVSISSALAFGISIYEGAITNDFGIVFNNDGNFTDLFNSLNYITGTSSLLPSVTNEAIVAMNLGIGTYTVAVGGNEGFFDFITPYTYDISFSNVAKVAEPQVLFAWFMGLSLILLLRKMNQH
ncbi:PEP-CTERM sorting domain-containing protein [Agaribacter marinus]|uniref:PEP-CTERM protein-sorting domain-containing protein n=1 Tax=Agaribacter marinus TaxID=1431249 RepID=A0AA37SUI8_9ALTE|nr:PEP-CTERM sorting domain-containing protein [Agaribacter marinus]GLR69312.1 hypothetical protein GCM10007852_02200 [Agaribacter marinus]